MIKLIYGFVPVGVLSPRSPLHRQLWRSVAWQRSQAPGFFILPQAPIDYDEVSMRGHSCRAANYVHEWCALL
ncbi:hypothetical protein BGZ63DRAFT_375263 [Mariannaea sp. PMI_226]|nr:hypothetical protein BGZ63DRAFT_375263 [Mariannaea sp. PMI_226]